DKYNLKRIIPVVLCVFYCGIILTAYACEADASPAMFIEKKIYDFGKILEGRQMPHDFILENRGNETLKILKVRSNCACAVADYSEEIPPGQSGRISVVFDSKGSDGKVNHKVRVETNDPEQGNLDLSVQGYVDPVMHIEPKKVILEGNAGENIESEVIITSDPRHHFKIISVTSKRGKATCSFEELKDTESSKYRVTVANLSKEKEEYRDYIYLKTDSDVRSGISIMIKGTIH
ncbi:DUF1573 domain-containing protein, partial [Thermodesulfobacteriota bacterium]